ncbi:MAG: DUF4197 domain-containing protein [Myxococcota bacterium]
MKNHALSVAVVATLAVFALGASPVSESTAASGLKDALKVATERAVQTTSQTNGFLDNPKIRIPLPGKLETVATALRGMGMGAQVDELETSMNHAAEKASAEATPVFVDAISQMSFKDASAILQGNDTAATQYFEKKTTDPLRTKFSPIVGDAMKDVGVTKLYEQLVGQYTKSVPFASAPKLDLNGYVTDETLQGLFTVVGEEEKKIRTNPAARATDLLKQVFGGR